MVLPLYAIEIYIDSIEESAGNNDLVEKFAKLNGREFDARDKIEVFND